MKSTTTAGVTQVQNTKIQKCITGCQHEFQDSKYGPGLRVMNPRKRPGTSDQLYRCTVCGKEQ